jgi:hypothetical protein
MDFLSCLDQLFVHDEDSKDAILEMVDYIKKPNRVRRYVFVLRRTTPNQFFPLLSKELGNISNECFFVNGVARQLSHNEELVQSLLPYGHVMIETNDIHGKFSPPVLSQSRPITYLDITL